MYSHTRQYRNLQRTIRQLLLGRRVSQDRQAFHLVQNLPPVQESSKHSVQIVQVRLPFITNEKLRTIRVGSLVGHGQDASFIVNIVGMKLVGKGDIAPNGFATLGARLVGSVASLHHETFNVSVKFGAIVCAAGAKG